jgi:NRAMP (natural resistance-associated macrophage protein)-like metal ion transporter
MDPGNLDTDIQAGAQFQYDLIWVLVMASCLGLMLQTLATRLGVVTGRNLAQLCKMEYPGKLKIVLWLLAELTVIASDIPEVIGTAIALKLLFGLQLWIGVIITAMSVFIFLALSYFGVRKLEFFIAFLVGIILVCFLAEMFLSQVPFVGVLGGFVPTINSQMIFAMTSLTGAVVMPHNLYLHSGLVHSRDFGRKVHEIKEACKYNLIESAIAIGISVVINISVISVAGKVFFYNEEAGLSMAPQLLSQSLGKSANTLFAFALLASGQSSTMTGTFAGQFVMEGFLDLKVIPWVRAAVTRGMAIVPSLIIALVAGENGADDLIVFSQSLLSILLPFSLVPLLKFTNSSEKMGQFSNGRWLKIATAILSFLVTLANVTLVFTTVEPLLAEQPKALAGFLWFLTSLFALAYLGFLGYLIWRPLSPTSFAMIEESRLQHQENLVDESEIEEVNNDL